MARMLGNRTTSRYFTAIASALALASCSPDTRTPQEVPVAPPPPVIMPVDAGNNEYNLIDRSDPNGGPACTTLNLCVTPINGGYWEHPVDANVGTGGLNPFWDTHNDGTSECFNTDYDQPGNGLVLDCARSSWTNGLPLNLVPVFFYTPPSGPPVLVRELVWDMNEPNSSPQTAQVSIDFFRVYLCADLGTPNPDLYQTVTQVQNSCDRVYDIEVGGVSSGVQGTGLAWDGSTQGSGNALDYRILIPESLFEAQANTASCPYDPTGPVCGLWVVVHARLGGKGAEWITSGGFEEMSTVDRPIPAKKSGVKFHDLNANGVQNAGEPLLAGWTIYVDLDDDGVLDAGEPSAVTDATGAYQITAIPAGTYKVREVLQAGWFCSFPAAGANCYHEETFEDGDELTGNNFGNWTTATKAGTKFNDLDADGVKDAGEPGLQNWVIYVDYDNDGVLDAAEPSATTAANGTYTITGINPGTWRVKEVAQTGWTCSYPNPCYHEEAFTSGAALTGNDFGNWTTATKAGTKFHDLDADGVKDAGEGGLAGWVIYVDYDNDGVADAGEPSATTAANGTYTITGINPGTWRVKEVAQTGWTCSYPSPNCYHEEAFTSGAALTGNDFGNWTTATKAGTKFNDLDADGVKDAGEPGLAGWTIYVDYDNDGVADAGEPSATTAANGTYTITGINPGTWRVKEVAQAGWTCSYPNPCYHEEAFTSQAALTGNDFGNHTTATKSGMKFNDLDADGVKDAGEPGLPNWVIYVDYDDDGVLDAGEPSATTAGDGTYQISGVNPGTWKVKEVAQTGWTCSYPTPNCYHEETFSSGGALTNNDFGNWTTATKAGTKFNDLDADGVKDAGEGGLAGWVIYVDYDNDGVADAGEPSATTAANGTYTITGINPGTWRVKEVAQAGWTCSYPTPNCYHEEAFTSGAALTGNDFGNWTTATKAGTKFHDLDADGVKDAGEGGLAGWVIYVDYDNDGVLDATEPSATTAANGTYTITGINPGTWRVKEVAQAGWTCSYPNPCYHEEAFTSGGALTGNDFGNWTTATKSGMKFDDLDADGVKDAGEPGLSGWVIYVDYDNDGVKDAGEPSGTTIAGGTYSITGINPGTWRVREVAQAGWSCTFPTTTDAFGCYHQETFQSGGAYPDNDFGNAQPRGATLLIIDEDGIDNGLHYNETGGAITPAGPQFFSAHGVNDDKPSHTQRDVLRYFAQNVGRTITVVTGRTDDEGWFAPNCIPQKWLSGGSNTCLTGADRTTAIGKYWAGIGGVPPQDKLDKIPWVVPLRALGLSSLIGKDVCAVVYDSDISINYDLGKPLGVNGNLQGETLGIVAFHVNDVRTLNGFSSSTLPEVQITILGTSVCGNWVLFNAPVPASSSVPNDRVAYGSPAGYYALKVWASLALFY